MPDNSTMKIEKLRVLHAVGSLNRGGIETWLMNLVRQRSEVMHLDFFVSTPGGAYEDEARSYGCKIYISQQISRFQKRLNILGFGKSDHTLEKVLKSGKYDVLHAHGTEFLGDAMKTAAKCGVPVRVAHCHTAPESLYKRFNENPEMLIRGIRFVTLDRYRILKYATDIVACSTEAGRFFVSRKWDIDKRCRLLFCAVPLDHFNDAQKKWTRKSFRNTHGIPEDAIVIGHAGSMQLDRRKNHFFILKIFKELAARNERYFLFMAGDGPLRPSIEQEVKNLGLQHRVSIPGLFKDVPSLMTFGFDMHILPSLYEGLPVVGLEAAASGLFTVCSNKITKDLTEKFASRVTALSLEASISEWADEVEKAISKRIPPDEGICLIQKTPFSICNSSNDLFELYRHRLEENG